jgi:hypothetical protein
MVKSAEAWQAHYDLYRDEKPLEPFTRESFRAGLRTLVAGYARDFRRGFGLSVEGRYMIREARKGHSISIRGAKP